MEHGGRGFALLGTRRSRQAVLRPYGPCPAALRYAERFADVGTPTGGALALIGYAWYRRRLASGYYDDVR